MVNLIDLIYNEFERAGYISSDGFLWKHQKYKDYWVVREVAGDYILTELQNLIVGKLAEERAKEPEMEKNTSLLIIRKVNIEEFACRLMFLTKMKLRKFLKL